MEEKMGKSKLEEVREKQLDRLVTLKFHERFGVPEKAFRSLVSLPKREENPLLVVSKEATSLKDQMKLIGSPGQFVIQPHLDRVRYPDSIFYWIYGVENGKDLLNVSPFDARKRLEEAGRRGLIFQEAIAIEAQFPGTLKDHGIDVIGSQVKDLEDSVLCLSLMNGKPEPGERFIKLPAFGYGVASCLK